MSSSTYDPLHHQEPIIENGPSFITITSKEFLYSRFTYFKISIMVLLKFGVNFLLAYITTDESGKYCFETDKSAFLSILISAFLASIVQSGLEGYELNKYFDSLISDGCTYKITNLDDFISGYFYLFPSIRISNGILRLFCVALQSLFFSFFLIAIMVLNCINKSSCEISRLNYSTMMGFYITLQTLVFYPVIISAIAYNRFILDQRPRVDSKTSLI